MDGQSDGQPNPPQRRAFSWDSHAEMINGWAIWPSTYDKEKIQLIREYFQFCYMCVHSWPSRHMEKENVCYFWHFKIKVSRTLPALDFLVLAVAWEDDCMAGTHPHSVLSTLFSIRFSLSYFTLPVIPHAFLVDYQYYYFCFAIAHLRLLVWSRKEDTLNTFNQVLVWGSEMWFKSHTSPQTSGVPDGSNNSSALIFITVL